jgi:hypothetical protein
VNCLARIGRRRRERTVVASRRISVGEKVEEAIRQELDAGHGILKVAKLVGVGSGTMQRVKREMSVAA